MKHYNVKAKQPFSLSATGNELLKELAFPFFMQFVVLYILRMAHRFSITKGALILPCIQEGDEFSSPTLGRFIFMLVALIGSFALVTISSKLSKKNDNRTVGIVFWISFVAGILLWQAIGEDAWQFGVIYEGEFVTFHVLESVSSLFILIPFMFLLIYAAIHDYFDWGMWIAIASFLCNWLGHFASLGTYPFISNLVDRRIWYLSFCGTLAAVLMISGLYLGLFAAKNKKGRMFASMICYIAVGTLALALIE